MVASPASTKRRYVKVSPTFGGSASASTHPAAVLAHGRSAAERDPPGLLELGRHTIAGSDKLCGRDRKQRRPGFVGVASARAFGHCARIFDEPTHTRKGR